MAAHAEEAERKIRKLTERIEKEHSLVRHLTVRLSIKPIDRAAAGHRVEGEEEVGYPRYLGRT